METLRLYSSGQDVLYLQQLLHKKGYNIYDDGDFGELTQKHVMQFQKDCKLVVDGIVGKNTWDALIDTNSPYFVITDADYKECARILNVDPATIKAVREVETGNKNGFLSIDKPIILFEGHIFWDQLKKYGLKPEDYETGNRDILYKTWTKKYYRGGQGEYERLNRAIQIHQGAALKSTSWGLFQIMGFNHNACGCRDIYEFVEEMKKNERTQLKLFTRFIKSNGLDKYLRNQDWASFAKYYNGPAYTENKYDVKLKQAYEKYRE